MDKPLKGAQGQQRRGAAELWTRHKGCPHACLCVCVYALQNELQNTKCVYSQCSFCACKCTTGYRGAGWRNWSTVDGYVKALKHFIICAKAHTHANTHAHRDRHRARLCTHIESINKSLSKNCKCRLKCITHMLTQTLTLTAQTKWQKYLKLLLCCPVALLVCCSVACHTHTHTHSVLSKRG